MFFKGSSDTKYGVDENNARKWVNWQIPQHKVNIKSFYLGKFQVTQKQYQKMMGNTPSHFKDENKLPVEKVSWRNAIEFCKCLLAKTRKSYRLPSEAEWEYACRVGSTTPFAFGQTITPDIVNYDGNYPYGQSPKGKYRAKTIPVGSLGIANNFGLYDMHGNVWEWCQDQWHDNYKSAPTDGSAWVNTFTNNIRVLRGGSWLSLAYYCCSAHRLYRDDTFGANYTGFRVALDVESLK